MSRSPATSKSPLRSTHDNREKKKAVINESVERLSSPPRAKSPINPTAGGTGKEDDMIFSIKMSKDEYNQYKRTREAIKPEATVKSTAKTGYANTYSGTKRSVTPTKRR